MQLGEITPIILTYNEEPNIGRALERLTWAKDVVVVDSFSTDRTLEIISGFPNVRIFRRSFDDFARQSNYALSETGIETEWVLALDSDYLLSDAGAREIAGLSPAADVGGYEAQFRYCVYGRPLRRCLYPARTVLFRRVGARFYRDGHAHRVKITGATASLRERIDHDDRKPIGRWITSQDSYAIDEREKLLLGRGHLNVPDRLRTLRFIAPVLVLVYCLFVKRMILEGLPGWYYTYQRVTAEILLSLYLIEHRFREPAGQPERD